MPVATAASSDVKGPAPAAPDGGTDKSSATHGPADMDVSEPATAPTVPAPQATPVDEAEGETVDEVDVEREAAPTVLLQPAADDGAKRSAESALKVPEVDMEEKPCEQFTSAPAPQEVLGGSDGGADSITKELEKVMDAEMPDKSDKSQSRASNDGDASMQLEGSVKIGENEGSAKVGEIEKALSTAKSHPLFKEYFTGVLDGLDPSEHYEFGAWDPELDLEMFKEWLAGREKDGKDLNLKGEADGDESPASRDSDGDCAMKQDDKNEAASAQSSDKPPKRVKFGSPAQEEQSRFLQYGGPGSHKFPARPSEDHPDINNVLESATEASGLVVT